jgi:methionyl-tRNA synthetase
MSDTVSTKPQNLPYDTFAQFDIRVGTIVSAEAIPKSKKLLKLQVNFAEERGPRTILAGIAESYNPEGVVGLKIVAILNLAPRTMMGIQSEGMLLAGRDVQGMVSLVGANAIVSGGEVG